MSESILNKKSLIFSGGGTRFGIYIGMLAALNELGYTPDYIIGSCGGSFACSIIGAFDNDEKRREYLLSEELYQFICSLQTTTYAKLNRLPMYCFSKLLDNKNAYLIEDIYTKYLVEMPQKLDDLLPSFSKSSLNSNFKFIIVGSKILFSASETNSIRRETQKLYKKVYFTDVETKHLLKSQQLKNYDYPIDGAIDLEFDIQDDISLLQAARISVSDMYYVAPILFQETYYSGGAIDLMPIEIALALSQKLFIQKKKGYTRLEQALVRTVLGYDGNKRLQDAANLANKYDTFIIDTTDEKDVLNDFCCTKKIKWSKFKVEIQKPLTLKDFRSQMTAQWEYGYSKIKQQTILKS